MGSTIGINTMILIASCLFLIPDVTKASFSHMQGRYVSIGFWIMNILLLFFWLALIVAGIMKSRLVMQDQLSFQDIMLHLRPYIGVIGFTGVGIFASMGMVFIPQLQLILTYLFRIKK
jgi:cbb3-type cytochrome oxidase subunit 1